MIKKYRLKLSLIDDYIFVLHLQKTYKVLLGKFEYHDYYDLIDAALKICQETIKTYDKVFLRLKLLNSSLILLNRQINETILSNFAENTNKRDEFLHIFKQNTQKIKIIIEKLPQKLQKLSLNPIEINYIVNHLIIA